MMNKLTTTFKKKRCKSRKVSVLFTPLHVVPLCGMAAVGFLYVIVQTYVQKTYGFG